MTAIKEKALSLQEYRDIRAKEQALEELVSHYAEFDRTIEGMKEATISQLAFQMESSRGIYAEYGANAFWSFCEALSYIFGEKTWNNLYKEATHRAGDIRHNRTRAKETSPALPLLVES